MDIKKRERRYSTPSNDAKWRDRMISGFSNNVTLPGSHDQSSGSSFIALPGMGQGNRPFDSMSAPPEHAATDVGSASPEQDAETDCDEVDLEKFWIEKDEERLAVIFDMEKTMAGMKEKLTNTVMAFQIAAEASQNLQTELEKKDTTLSQVKEDMEDLLHNLDATEMDNEKLEDKLANSRTDCKYQFDRAEEALTSTQMEPSRGIIAELAQAKAEWESEKDSLEFQLKERCESVAHLTETLSRVADSDRWQEVKNELEEIRIRADQLPADLQAALLECDKWKKRHDIISQEHEKLLSEKASFEEVLQGSQELSLSAIRELKRKYDDKAASERALKRCLKRNFERMVRCSLLLGIEGYLPFDEKHQEICEKVSELTGRDYQEPLLAYYDEHDIRGDFNSSYDGAVDDEEVMFVHEHGVSAGGEDLDVQGNDQEPTRDSSSAPTPVIAGDDSISGTPTKMQEAYESPIFQEARNEGEVIHTDEPQSTAADEAFSAATNPIHVAQDQRGNGFSDGVQGFGIFCDGTSFSTLIFQSTDFSTPTSNKGANKGKSFDFGFSNEPPPSLFAKFTTSSEAEADDRSTSPKSVRASKSAKTAAPSRARKGHSQGIWNDTSFGTGETDPSSTETSAANFKADPKGKSPVFKSFVTSQRAEATTPASETLEVKQNSEATAARKEQTPTTTKTAPPPPQLQDFDFGGNSSPAAFTSPSPTPSTPIPKPATARMSSLAGHDAAPATVVPKEKTTEGRKAKDGTSKEDVSKINAPIKKASKDETETPSNENALNVNPPAEKNAPQNANPLQETPAPPEPQPPTSPPRRSRTRAAKDARSREKRRSQLAMVGVWGTGFLLVLVCRLW